MSPSRLLQTFVCGPFVVFQCFEICRLPEKSGRYCWFNLHHLVRFDYQLRDRQVRDLAIIKPRFDVSLLKLLQLHP